MSGMMKLKDMLGALDPQLGSERWVFLCLSEPEYLQLQDMAPLATFQEAEGITVVVSEAEALQLGKPVESVFRQVTLQVHSSLDAVGLTAAVSTCLTQAEISANVIAAYYHDHIFVPEARAEDALAALLELKNHSG